jgi:hypothetical protein
MNQLDAVALDRAKQGSEKPRRMRFAWTASRRSLPSGGSRQRGMAAETLIGSLWHTCLRRMDGFSLGSAAAWTAGRQCPCFCSGRSATRPGSPQSCSVQRMASVRSWSHPRYSSLLGSFTEWEFGSEAGEGAMLKSASTDFLQTLGCRNTLSKSVANRNDGYEAGNIVGQLSRRREIAFRPIDHHYQAITCACPRQWVPERGLCSRPSRARSHIGPDPVEIGHSQQAARGLAIRC